MGKNEKVSQGPFCRWRRSRRLGIATLLLTTNRLHRWHDTTFGDLVLILAVVVVAQLVKRLPSVPDVRDTSPISDIDEIF